LSESAERKETGFHFLADEKKTEEPKKNGRGRGKVRRPGRGDGGLAKKAEFEE